MGFTQNAHTLNYLNDKLKSLAYIYGPVKNNRFLSLYSKIPTPLDEFFGFLHFNFNNLLHYMNSRLNTRHYTADESRSLFYLINELRNIQDTLTGTTFDFDVDTYYDEVLGNCLGFLQTSGGSTIPSDFQRVKIIEISPIFTLKAGLTIKRSDGILTFPTEEIGTGSYATVYKFTDPLYNKEFAYKKAHITLEAHEKERFYTEFEVMKGLKSPFILEVYTLNKEQNYYVMEYADETLENYIQQNPGLENEREKLLFIRQICKAFIRIHSEGIYHRDISPKNILIKHFDDTKIIKVADFGLVKVPESELTRFGTELKGYLNDPYLGLIGFKNYKAHHDTYALTRLIYYIFTGKTADGIFSNPHFEGFYKKGTHFETEQRYSNIQELEKAFFENVAPSLKELGV
ncbi:protein kinase family protein [Bacillus cereus]|uniref:protein kinase family protein n=1 Tax=Bacillus cereus TaxID=1396 RepID=UPI00382C0AD1